MKKFLATICAAALLFTGCSGGSGGEDKPAVDKPADNFSANELKLGMATRLNTDEEKMGGILDGVAEKFGLKAQKHLPKFYDNLNAMQMGIESGEIQAISTYNCVAEYLVANNSKFEIVPNEALNKLSDYFCFAVRKDDTALKAELDKAINEMKSDGTLDKFINEYITNVSKGQAPPKVEIAKVEGADTIKVGVTGDLPPLDLVLPDGSPAGFNTALLAEISKRIGKNIELVQVDTGARAAALTSKVIDVVFWVILPVGQEVPIDIDKPEGLELSMPYFKDDVAVVKLKDNK
ncbi:MAG: transporter substrate-binding domain-containing protein [Selenomonadaceae bacterium]|nr:transporter substrate-binding domain-containing protein [Selenomonadaceae bacterium]